MKPVPCQSNVNPCVERLPELAGLAERLELACRWLTDVSQVRADADLTPNEKKHQLRSWQGAFRGNYTAATREWSHTGPLWHAGQAVKALVMAHAAAGLDTLPAAQRGADFILANRVTEGPDRGLLLGYEDHPDKVNTSAILEALDGLFALSEATGDKAGREAALVSLDWVMRNAYFEGQGIFRDIYDPTARRWIERGFLVEGRPLLDDAMFVKAWRLTGNADHLRVAVETAERLLRDEKPAGNWIVYPPCYPHEDKIHPRQAFWWGLPMLDVYRATGDARFRDCFERSVEWYRRALRADGGMHRFTRSDFNTDSFDHATSGSACAAILFMEHYQLTGDPTIVEPLRRALQYCMSVQFLEPADPNLRGAVLEKVRPPDGSDRSPYYLRDLANSFFVQAAARYLQLTR